MANPNNSLSESKLNSNYLNYIKYLEKYNCYSKEMMDDIGDKIKYATYSRNVNNGGAYAGALIDVTLNVLCRFGAQINNNTLGANGGDKILHPLMCVNNEMLMRVLLLLNIAKADMFVEADTWHVNRGMPYTFADTKTKLKLGERSLYLCQKYGINLEEEEFEAFLSIDSADENGECFQSPLYTVVKAAKMLTAVELRQKYLNSINKETIEV